jgi:hypothetical protein
MKNAQKKPGMIPGFSLPAVQAYLPMQNVKSSFSSIS